MTELTEDKKQKLYDKILKLLNMTPEHGCSESEAATAMEMSQKLLIKYNLDMASIKDNGNGTGQDEATLINEIIDFDKWQPWRWSLVAAIGHSNFCKTIRSNGDIHILGRKANVRAVVTMYNWLEPQIIRLASQSGYIRTEKTSYILGIISTVRKHLIETMDQAKVNTETRALVVNVQGEIDTWYKQQFPNARTSRSTSIHVGAYGHGQSDGGKVSIYGSNRQVNSGRLQLS